MQKKELRRWLFNRFEMTLEQLATLLGVTGSITNDAPEDTLPISDGVNFVASPATKIGDSLRVSFPTNDDHGTVLLVIDGDNENVAVTAPSGLFVNGAQVATGEQLTLDGFTDGVLLTTASEQLVPLAPQAHISGPTGGVVIDAEARTSIAAILAALETAGITSV